LDYNFAVSPGRVKNSQTFSVLISEAVGGGSLLPAPHKKNKTFTKGNFNHAFF